MEEQRIHDSIYGEEISSPSVADVGSTDELIRKCYKAFGAQYVADIYRLLDEVISRKVPLVIAAAGPITVSDQHRAWLIPMIEAGWVAYLTTTGAVAYHDGHRCLGPFATSAVRRVPLAGHDEELAEDGVIRVANTGFSESLLYDQDRFFSAMLMRDEFQRIMSGTEYRHLLGMHYANREERFGTKPGLLSTCAAHGVPVFVGAPGDASDMLNAMKLRAMRDAGLIPRFDFSIDVLGEVFESCAYHFWCLARNTNGPRELAILILGGGVPKNFSLQPEPALSQVLLLKEIGGYEYHMQIVSVPPQFGCLTSCEATEAHTWGKVTKEAIRSRVRSLQADYSLVMPLIARALLEKRAMLAKLRESMPASEFFARHTEWSGYLDRRGGLRLYDKRDECVSELRQELTKDANAATLLDSLTFDL